MRQIAPQSIGTILISSLAAAAGDALYRWWRHGTADRVGVAVFGLGWAAAAVGISFLAGMKKRPRQLTQNGSEG